MAKVELSPAAVQKLEDIRAHISIDLASPVAAQNTIDKIFEAMERLERFPDSAPLLSALYEKVPARYENARFLVCGNYIAIYNQVGDVVQVLQIYHGAEDYIQHLFKT